MKLNGIALSAALWLAPSASGADGLKAYLAFAERAERLIEGLTPQIDEVALQALAAHCGEEGKYAPYYAEAYRVFLEESRDAFLEKVTSEIPPEPEQGGP